jgi:hypothetical protein
MAIDLEKIRQRKDNDGKDVSKGDDRFLILKENSSVVIRLIPVEDGDPFKDYHMHYNMGKAFLCPKKNFGNPCAACEMARAIYSDKTSTEAQKAIAKQLNATKRKYSQVRVRGDKEHPDRSLIWGYSAKTAASFYELILNPDYGDISDPYTGVDITIVTTAKDEKSGNYSILVTPKRKESKLADTDEDIKNILETAPKIEECLLSISAEEIEKRVADFLAPKRNPAQVSRDDKVDLDKVMPVAGSANKEDKAPAKTAPAKKAKEVAPPAPPVEEAEESEGDGSEIDF